MALPHNTTVWLIRQGVRLASAMALAAERLGNAAERLERRLEAAAGAQGVDMRDVLEPLTEPLSLA